MSSAGLGMQEQGGGRSIQVIGIEGSGEKGANYLGSAFTAMYNANKVKKKLKFALEAKLSEITL
jgi:hypothetical protein